MPDQPPKPKFLTTSGSKSLDWLIDMLSGGAWRKPMPPAPPKPRK